MLKSNRACQVSAAVGFDGFSGQIAALQQILNRIHALALTRDNAEQGFAAAVQLTQSPLGVFILMGLLFALMFHLVAGIKHLLLDFHMGDTYEAAQRSAIITVVVSVVLTVLIGAAIW